MKGTRRHVTTTCAARLGAARLSFPLLSLAGALALPAVLQAQEGPEVSSRRGTQELGIDAGATFALGDQSSVLIDLPAARARMGFFRGPNPRWSFEPAIGLSFVKVEDADARLSYNIEAGALYHLQPGGDLATLGATVAYIRPFVGLVGFTGSGGDSELSLGGGFGVKIPWRESLAWRFEANTGYGLDNEAWRLGANVGVSFFTRGIGR